MYLLTNFYKFCSTLLWSSVLLLYWTENTFLFSSYQFRPFQTSTYCIHERKSEKKIVKKEGRTSEGKKENRERQKVSARKGKLTKGKKEKRKITKIMIFDYFM